MLRKWAFTASLILFLCSGLHGRATTATDAVGEEIPLEKCDRLPVVRVHVGKTEMRFLVDSGATTILNIKSFGGAETSQIKISSWTGDATTSAREVTLPEFSLGSHQLHNLKVPAIDLSPIGKACGGQIDGLFGVDMMEKMGLRIDFERRLASFKPTPEDAKRVYDDMERDMHPCVKSFERGDAKAFESCLDPEIVLYTPYGRVKGKPEVIQFMRQRYFQYAPRLSYTTSVHEARILGEALWYSYDFVVSTPKERIKGQGISMCRKSEGRWRLLNMHHSFLERAPAEPGK
jgi:Domain of unknown function (DUF4440)/Aspartyl protease